MGGNTASHFVRGLGRGGNIRVLVLDTDHLSLLEWTSSASALHLEARLDETEAEDIVTTIITYEEQTRGWLAYVARARTTVQLVDAYRQLNRHLDTYRPIRVLGFEERAATEYQRLRQARVRIGTMDLKIAAIVLAQDATLLSRNLADFRQVPGLRVEDWTE